MILTPLAAGLVVDDSDLNVDVEAGVVVREAKKKSRIPHDISYCIDRVTALHSPRTVLATFCSDSASQELEPPLRH